MLTTLAPMCTLRAVSLFLLIRGTWGQGDVMRRQIIKGSADRIH